MKTLIMILLLSVPTFAQELIDPVRISITDDLEGTQDDRKFNEYLRDALNKYGDIAFTSSSFDYKIVTVTTSITEKGKLIGYSAAIAKLTYNSGKINILLHIETGPTLEVVAENTASFLQRGRYANNLTSSK